MGQRPLRIVLAVMTVLAGAACGTGPPSASARSAASSYDEYAVASCAAWDALFRAVGNPDTASGSDLSRSLDQAVASGDAGSAERVAAEIVKELRVGREQVAIAGGWQPRADVMVQLDRVFAAFEAMTTAKLALARHEPNAIDPQSAFEQAGGVEAYFAWIEALRATGAGAGGASTKQCPNVPVTP